MLKRVILILCGLLLPAVVTAGQPDIVRPAAVAGSWYPGDKAQLGAYVDSLLNGENHAGSTQEQVLALIAPHAGYRYSGAVAGAAYRLVRGRKFSRVLLLAPAHHVRFHGLSIADVTHYETPLGRIPLDLDAIRQLRPSSLVTAIPAAHREEHSLEMQLPLLQRALQPGWQLVPVLVGQLLQEDYPAAAEVLRPLLDDNTLSSSRVTSLTMDRVSVICRFLTTKTRPPGSRRSMPAAWVISWTRIRRDFSTTKIAPAPPSAATSLLHCSCTCCPLTAGENSSPMRPPAS